MIEVTIPNRFEINIPIIYSKQNFFLKRYLHRDYQNYRGYQKYRKKIEHTNKSKNRNYRIYQKYRLNRCIQDIRST